jgi:hypothetical protein
MALNTRIVSGHAGDSMVSKREKCFLKNNLQDAAGVTILGQASIGQVSRGVFFPPSALCWRVFGE